MLNYTIKEFEGVKVVELLGNIDSVTSQSFKPFLDNITLKESVMINMENVEMVTSAGMNVLIDCSFAAKDFGKRIVLLWAKDDFKEMAETLDVYNYLIFAESFDEGKIKIQFYT